MVNSRLVAKPVKFLRPNQLRRLPRLPGGTRVTHLTQTCTVTQNRIEHSARRARIWRQGRGLSCEIPNFPEVVLYVVWCRDHRRDLARSTCVCTRTFFRCRRFIPSPSEITSSSPGAGHSIDVAVLVGRRRWRGGRRLFDSRICSSILGYLFWRDSLRLGSVETQTRHVGNYKS